MNNDAALIEGVRQAIRSSSTEFCRAYSDLAATKSGAAVLSVLDGQLRLVQKVAELDSMYGSVKSGMQVPQQEIYEYIQSQGIN